MSELKNIVKDAQDIIITGHKRPDGDCIGACIAAYHYLKGSYPEKNIRVYLENVPERFSFLDPDGQIVLTEVPDSQFDLFIAFDSGSADMLGEAEKLLHSAKVTVCIDHHVSNKGYAGHNILDPEASSTCEILYGLMDYNDIDTKTAEALYTGIIFDSGVFRYSNTSKKTMEIAGSLIEKGIPFWDYVDRCFFQRTYTQAQLLGRTLLTSMRLMDGKCIVATITRRMMEFYGAQPEDVEGIIEQLRITKDVEVAILLYETGEQEYKVSMRSNKYVNVNKIATYFGGGGHIKAAGFTMRGSVHDVVNNITEHIEL
ncbi:MAG: bifunctional oligoribonuclease/PAP phosphatase NrnA [Lachnospiraceae bacterium]|jgi:Exopolyphosphatase-related proteins